MRLVPAFVAAALLLLSVAAWPSAPAAAPAGERSAALFTQMATVLQHPRCMNCHTVTAFPRQGDDRRRHFLNVARGSDGRGSPGMRCGTCHAAANQTIADVPGAPHWGLAPLAMGWEGLSVHQLCAHLLDRTRNGGRDVATLVHHLSDDPLVGWAWHPGGHRAPVPIDRPTFRRIVTEWAASGAGCPA